MLRVDRRREERLERHLARCLERWIPRVSIEGAHATMRERADDAENEQRSKNEVRTKAPARAPCFVGDLAGCAMLFRSLHGTEQELMRRIAASFLKRGLHVRIAIASTVGAAVALARYGASSASRSSSRSSSRGSPRNFPPVFDMVTVARGAELRHLDPLPIEALRIEASIAEALRSVEVCTIGQLARLRREGIAARLCGVLPFDSSNRQTSSFTKSRQSTVPFNRASATAIPRAKDAGDPTASDSQVHESKHKNKHEGKPRGREHQASLFEMDAGATRDSKSQVERREHETAPRHNTSRHERTLREEKRDSSVAKAHRHAMFAADVLHRLDQALGTRSEILTPIAVDNPIRIRREFDGPCNRIETILLACGEMVGQLARQLRARREGLRYAQFRFRHADLPADLSTDAFCAKSTPRALTQTRHQERTPSDTPPTHAQTHAFPDATHESLIELRLAQPHANAAHLWNVLRQKLEQLPLDHGVESIDCAVQESVLQRFRQSTLRLDDGRRNDDRVGDDRSSDKDDSRTFTNHEHNHGGTEGDAKAARVAMLSTQHPSHSDDGHEVFRSPRDQSRDQSRDLPRGWSTSVSDDARARRTQQLNRSERLSHASALDPAADSAVRARQQEWLDLVRARLGEDSIRLARAPERDSERKRTAALAPDRFVAPTFARGMSNASSRGASNAISREFFCAARPPQMFTAPEPAQMFGASYSDELAQSMSCRSAWMSLENPTTPNPSSVPRSTSQMLASVPPSALESARADVQFPQAKFMSASIPCVNERSLRSSLSVPYLCWRGHRWPLSAIDGWERQCSTWWELSCDENAHAREQQRGGDVDEKGRVYARIRVGCGLWLFTRWPVRLIAARAHEHDSSHDSSHGSLHGSPHSSSHISSQNQSGDQPHEQLLRKPCVPQRLDHWISGCALAIKSGVNLEVLGVWG